MTSPPPLYPCTFSPAPDTPNLYPLPIPISILIPDPTFISLPFHFPPPIYPASWIIRIPTFLSSLSQLICYPNRPLPEQLY